MPNGGGILPEVEVEIGNIMAFQFLIVLIQSESHFRVGRFDFKQPPNQSRMIPAAMLASKIMIERIVL